MSEAKPAGVPISELGAEQINQLVKQVEQELAFFQESLNSLKGYVTKSDKSMESLKSLSDTQSGHQALIPLSESMYIRAELSDPSRSMVEIGTGYFAEMKREKAIEFFERKKKYILTQVETIEKILLEKKRTRAVLSETLQQKIASQIAALPK